MPYYDDPRLGSRVQRFTYIEACDIDTGGPTKLLYGGLGTVIEEGEGAASDRDLRNYLVIRWDDGRLQRIEYRYGEECSPDVDVVDVTPKLFVNVYLWDRAYGGPEEGDWWYDTYAPVEDHCKQADCPATAEAYYQAQQDWADQENADRHHPNSVISDGHYVVMLECRPAKFLPEVTPTYC